MMEAEKIIPEGDYCYILRVFGKSCRCPDLVDEIVMSPVCSKFDVELGWTVSGRILKCNKCLEEVKK